MNAPPRKRRLSRKTVSTELLPQFYEYENQYEKWRMTRPKLNYELSIDESGTIYWIWTFLVVCGCLYNILMLSVLAFENFRSSYFEFAFPVNIFFDIIFFFDIIIRARLGFYEDGVLVTTAYETSKNYFRSKYFALDALAIIPFDLIYIRRTSSAFCRLNRFLKVYRIDNFIGQSYRKVRQVTISLAKIITSCFLLFHLNACIFYIISVNSDTSSWDGVNATFDDDEFLPWPYTPEKITDVYLVGCHGQDECYNKDFYFDEAREQHLLELYDFWRHNNRTKIVHFSTFSKEYALSMYWSSLTMTTLGEQPAPNTSIQNIFEVLNTVAGLVLFAVIMGSVGDLVANANKVKSNWQTLMDGLKQYMMYRNLNPELQLKVLKYCEYEMAEETILKEHQVRDELPEKLYGQVSNSIIGKSLLKSLLFRVSERSFLREISEWLTPQYFCPGDVVIEKGQLCDVMFIIVCGRIIEMMENGEIEHFEGEVLGDVNLIWFENHTNQNRHVNNFVSNSYSQIHILTRDEFLKILSSYDATLKSRLYESAYRIQKDRGELNDLKKKVYEINDLETNLRNLSSIVCGIEENLSILESEFVKFTNNAKQRLFKSENCVCNLLKQQTKPRNSIA